MKKIKVLALALLCSVFTPSKADEGMWLLQLMKEQNLADKMKAQGLKMNISDIYNPEQITLKDAVGIFGRGCTGEIISPNGLILTNHHCGYDAIQQHSSVEHDYLTDGFWAKSLEEELPTPGLTFKFVERIVDVTDRVNNDIEKGKIEEAESFGSEYLKKIAADELKKSDLKKAPGITTMALPFYEGNRFYVFYIKTYTDVRMVAAPPSSIGKFGGETDNWMWPRHTGDFSMFRIYTDKKGNPADYSKHVFRMYDTDEPVAVQLRCHVSVMKYLLDNFGDNFEAEAIDEESFKATVSVCTSTTFYRWVFGFNGKIRIIGPQSVKKSYREMLLNALNAI